MICEDCLHCKSHGMNDNKHKIICGKRNSGFSISGDFADTFACSGYEKAEYVEPEQPPKENVLIVLAGSGRDFALYEPEVEDKVSLHEYIMEQRTQGRYIHIGDACFSSNEIAAFMYIGD